MDAETQIVVIDSGSGLTKAGFAEENVPRAIFPTLLGRPWSGSCFPYIDFYVGDEAIDKRYPLSLTYPIKRGVVTDWNDIEKIWNYAFVNELRAAPEEHPCFFVEPPLTPSASREKTTLIVFETFNVPAFYSAVSAELALYASGRTTGVVIESGDGVTHTAAVEDGYALPQSIQKLDLAGRDMTENLDSLLRECGRDFTTSAEMNIARDMKEKMCFVSLDFQAELEASQKDILEKSYELPDGSVLSLSRERFQCPEILFRPSFPGRERDGLVEMAMKSAARCNIDLRRSLYANIVLAGGSTMFPGTAERISKEVCARSSTKVSVIAPPDRKFSAWIGGSILSSLSSFRERWISMEEYEEYGPTIVHRKSSV